MSERQSLILIYTPLESGDAESRWLRVEQEKFERDESISVAEAAAIVDSLYGIEPCNDGMGGGGEETDEENEPETEKVETALAEMLDRAGMCRAAEYWTTTVRVLRSHKEPQGYELRSETATVEATEPVRESYRQDVEVSGAVIELDMPYDGGLTGIPEGVQWTVRGSTVNLDRPVNARLRLRYGTWYERVTLRVPTDNGKTDQQSAIGVVGGGGESKRQRPELTSAAVAAFWAELAASCELEPPELDEDANAEEIEELCRKKPGSSPGGMHHDDPGECWKSVTHYDLCSCSKRRVNVWTETVPAPCDDAVSEDDFGRYVHCDGEEDDIADPEYYYRRCCKPPPGNSLPTCRRSYAVYKGGHAIENGAAYWKNIYGPDVALVPVLPEGGICGEIITEWNVPSKNCCDEVPELEAHPDNPRTIVAPGAVRMAVLGGQSPRSWRVSAGYTLDNGQSYKREGGMAELVIAGEDACNNAVVEVSDGCSTVRMPLTRENPVEEMSLSPEDATVAPEAHLQVIAENAQGEVFWSAGQLRLISPQGGHGAIFEAPQSFCGTDEVTAADACGRTATMRVLSTYGVWEEVTDFDPCTAPWGGRAPTGSAAMGGTKGCVGGLGYRYGVPPIQGYTAQVCHVMSTLAYISDRTGCSHEGSCDERLAEYVAEMGAAALPCGYTGYEMIGDRQGNSLYSCNAGYWMNHCKVLCNNVYACYGTYETNAWQAGTQYILQLWRWTCP